MGRGWGAGVGEEVGASESMLVSDRAWWGVEAGGKLIRALISCGEELVISGLSVLSWPSQLLLKGLPPVCPGHVWKPPYGGLGEPSIQKQATGSERTPDFVLTSSRVSVVV